MACPTATTRAAIPRSPSMKSSRGVLASRRAALFALVTRRRSRAALVHEETADRGCSSSRAPEGQERTFDTF